MTNTIKLKDIKAELEKVINAGYGKTIELKINGEHYNIVK